MRAAPAAAAVRCSPRAAVVRCSTVSTGAAGVVRGLATIFFPCDAPSANTISWAAIPPPEEVGVPPTVIATYSVPPIEKIVGPAAIGGPALNVQSTLPVFVENARSTPSPPPSKPRPDAVVVTPPRSGSGVVIFQTRLPVATSMALIEPWSCQPGSSVPKSPFSSPRKTSPTSLWASWVGVSSAWSSTAAVSAAPLIT